MPLTGIDIRTIAKRHLSGAAASRIKNAALKQNELPQVSTPNIYSGAPHGMHTTHAGELNADVLVFIEVRAASRWSQRPGWLADV